MTMTTVTYPVAPTVTKRKGSLLDAATEVEAFAWQPGDGLFDSYNMLSFGERAEFCAPNAKDLDQNAVWNDGFRFAAYGGVTCKAIGLDQDHMKAEVARAFETGESTAVEQALMEYRFRESDGSVDGFPGVWDEPEDITPAGGAVKPAVGIALLEEYAAGLYIGAPTLHVPISVASLVLGVDGASFEGDVLRTKFGSKMAAGAGYGLMNTGPDGTEPDPDERWLYATGEVIYGRSPDITIQAMDYANNDVVVLAERGYLVAVDSFVAAILVSVE